MVDFWLGSTDWGVEMQIQTGRLLKFGGLWRTLMQSSRPEADGNLNQKHSQAG